MSKKSIDSSPISHLQDIFNVKQENAKSQSSDISLMTEINDQKVIMDFHWIKDLKVLISSFSIDNFEYSFLTNHINKINNNLVIGTLKQNTNNTIIYRHSLPITGCSTPDDMRLYGYKYWTENKESKRCTNIRYHRQYHTILFLRNINFPAYKLQYC